MGTKPFVFLCTRVYANGEAKETVRDLDGLSSWLDNNRTWRPGNALFVNGYRAHPSDDGYFNAAEMDAVEAHLLKDYEARAHALPDPDRVGPQVDRDWFSVNHYVGYRPEPHRASVTAVLRKVKETTV